MYAQRSRASEAIRENKKKIDMEMYNDKKNSRFKYQEQMDKQDEKN